MRLWRPSKVAHRERLVDEQCLIDRQCRCCGKKRIAVWIGVSDDLGCAIATSTAPVLNNDGLLQSLTHSFADQPRKRVGYTAGINSNHNSELSAWILLRPRLLPGDVENKQRHHRD